ncbi:MAG: DMT family transporter [Granulosicoccus sp.]|nr:DMT family transporter [Granulosicoccus sp.]
MRQEQHLMAATGLMLVVTVLSAFDTVIVRLLTADLHPFVIVFFRSVFGLAFVLPWIVSQRGILSSHYRLLHVVRAGLKMLSLAAFFTAIALVPLADVTAIAFTTPIFLTLGAWMCLGEKLLPRRILAVVIGFCGVLFILQPSQSNWSTPLLFALAGAVLTAIIQLMLKVMSAHDSTQTLVAWNLVVTVPMAAIPLLWFWNAPSHEQILLLVLQGAIGACNMAAMTRAMALAQASYIAPLDFLRLPAVALLGYVFFAEIPGNATVIGAIVIFLSTLLLAEWSTKSKKTNVKA